MVTPQGTMWGTSLYSTPAARVEGGTELVNPTKPHSWEMVKGRGIFFQNMWQDLPIVFYPINLQLLLCDRWWNPACLEFNQTLALPALSHTSLQFLHNIRYDMLSGHLHTQFSLRSTFPMNILTLSLLRHCLLSHPGLRSLPSLKWHLLTPPSLWSPCPALVLFTAWMPVVIRYIYSLPVSCPGKYIPWSQRHYLVYPCIHCTQNSVQHPVGPR